MLFNSIDFAVFLPIVFILYWALPHKFRWVLMLAASYYFYMSWNAKYVFLIFFTTVISYFAARLLEIVNSKKKKKWIMAGTTVLCLGVLFFFKYFNFVSESVAAVLKLFTIQTNPLTLKLLLPVGISFYTFQTLSYVIDVYKGDISAEHHFGYYATFISFFPQLVAGPIERTSNLLPQIRAVHQFDYHKATYGLKQMAWGFFKKVAIADFVSQCVSDVYNYPHNYHGFVIVLATILFAIQIYCDFSGYSDIAIGTAKLMGINLTANFRSPYFSQSIKEFWSRWHISLSTWFRDYVYIPLGGNRVGKARNAFNLMVTFLVSGLWHGANWTFVVWGSIHGAAQIVENRFISREHQKSTGILKWLRILAVFTFCAFAWIFFVSNSIEDAIYVICHLFDGIEHPMSYLSGFFELSMIKTDWFYILPSILLLGIFDYFSLMKDVICEISAKKTVVRWGIYILFTLWLLINIPCSNSGEFIYFQF